MLSEADATQIVLRKFNITAVSRPVDVAGLWIYIILGGDGDEKGYDPFFSVNQETGEVRDYSVVADGHGKEISDKFLALENQNDS